MSTRERGSSREKQVNNRSRPTCQLTYIYINLWENNLSHASNKELQHLEGSCMLQQGKPRSVSIAETIMNNTIQKSLKNKRHPHSHKGKQC